MDKIILEALSLDLVDINSKIAYDKNMPVRVKHNTQPKKSDKIMPYLAQNPLLISKQMTKIMLNNSDAEILLSSLTSVLGEMFDVEGCAVVMFKENTILSSVYWERNSQKATVLKQYLTVKKLILELQRVGETIELTDTEIKEIHQDLQLPDQLSENYTGLGINCSFQNQQNGIIVLWRNKLEKWQKSEKELLQTASEQIAIAIAQIQWQRQVNITNHHTNLINNLTTDIRNAATIEDTLQLSITETTKGLGVDRGIILLLKYADYLSTKSTVNKVPKARINLGADYWNLEEKTPVKYSSFALTDSILSTLAFTQSPLVIMDINEEDLGQNEKE
ncbi:MAG TPA: GAF domain-containing protein, partial [Allocoleopsis sp.]